MPFKDIASFWILHPTYPLHVYMGLPLTATRTHYRLYFISETPASADRFSERTHNFSYLFYNAFDISSVCTI